jgi:hypothetical protein
MEGVLGRTIQVQDAFLDGSNAVEDRGGKGNVVLDSVEQIVKFVDLREEVLLGISGPEKYDFVCFLFHISNILPQFINNFLISTQKDVVGPVSLVGCDEVTIERSGKRNDGLKLGLELSDQIGLKDL